jgi:hypothetical protein
MNEVLKTDDLKQIVVFQDGEIEFMPQIKNSKGNRWLSTLTLKKTNPTHSRYLHFLR